MGKLASLIMEDFATRTAREVPVPEWDAVLYVFPLTIGQLNAIDTEVSGTLRAVRTIIVRGKQADGAPLFDEDDYKKMISHAGGGRFGPAVIARVANEIMADELTTEDPDALEEALADEEKT